MSRPLVPNPRVAVCLLVALFAILPLAAGPAAAQNPTIPPGYVLVDDMILPWIAVYGESTWNGTLWPNGVIPYTFDAAVSTAQRAVALNGFAEWESVSGVDFVPRTNQADYLTIRLDPGQNGNSSQVGQIGGQQYINITNWNWGTLLHELGHTLGLKHEQSRPDRDSYVQINWQNISQTQCGGGTCNPQFAISSGATTFLPYDFDSCMHYSRTAFSVNGQDTITVLSPNQAWQSLIGQGAHMSIRDALGMADRYGTAPSPVVTDVAPEGLPTETGSATITVYGSGFHRGSNDGGGVLGSVVQWNSVDLDTTYVSPGELQAVVPAGFLNSPACVSIRVYNQAPGGGLSNTMSLNVYSSAVVPGSWVGRGPSDNFGRAVAGIGDVNGDGHDDVAVGSFGYDHNRGVVRAYSGLSGGQLWASLGPGLFDGDHLGQALAATGDIDGDGTGDVIIGAPGDSSTPGLVKVMSGVDGSTIHTITGANDDDAFGSAVASAGDVNGDGTPDIIIGIPGYNNNQGRVEVRSGASGGLIRASNGGSAGDQFGASVAGGADFNADGTPDVLVGAPYRDDNGTDSGRVSCFDPLTGFGIFTRSGAGAYDQFGYSVAVIPSILGLPLGTAVIGAPELGSGFGSGAGNGYVLVVNTIALLGSVSHVDVVTLNGPSTGDGFGMAVAPAGDIDDDTFMDFAIGAPRIYYSGGAPGYVRVVSSSSQLTLWTSLGTEDADLYGIAVAPAGDVDADGLPDLVVGAPGTGPCSGVGAARVIHPLVPPNPAKVMISEVTWGDPDGVEITNFGDATANLYGWKVLWNDGTLKTSSALSLSLAAGRTMIVKEPGGSFAEAPAGVTVVSAFPTIGTTLSDFTVALVNAGGMVVDEVRIADTSGNHTLGGLGGLFRGLAVRPGGQNLGAGVERIWGLDSNGGADWTAQPDRSFGLENRNSGARGTDPLPAALSVKINEIDASPDYIEISNFGTVSVNLTGWYVLCSAQQGVAHTAVRPWPASAPGLGPGSYMVLGDASTPPAEKPSAIPYIVTSENIPFNPDRLSCALYDVHGRLVDLVRAARLDSRLAHNHPRAPAPWDAFVGAAPQSNGSGDDALGRTVDTGTGADWRPVYARTMGSANGGFGGLAGHGHALDVRLNEGQGGGLAIIVNAGSALAGHRWSFFPSLIPSNGQGLFFGLGPDAIANFFLLNQQPPWAGILDANGSARTDFPPGTLPAGIHLENVFILQDPAGGLVLHTFVIDLDT